MKTPLWRLKKIPQKFNHIKNENINEFKTINIFFQDESRFGLKTHVGTCLTAIGVKPIVTYKHNFKNTYLYGAFSPLDGKSFVWEVEGVDSKIFEAYLQEFSLQDPDELKIVIIDNAGFHSTKNIKIPDNIQLINLPPYTPELNPAEKIWHYIKGKFKNQFFDDFGNLKSWLNDFVKNKLNSDLIKSITHDQFYLNEFLNVFNV